MAFHGRPGNKDICNHIIYTYWYFLSLLFQLISSQLFYRTPIDLVWKQTWYEVIWMWKELWMWHSHQGQQYCLFAASIFIPLSSRGGARLNGAFSLPVINFWPPPCANMPTLAHHSGKSWGWISKVMYQIARMVKFEKKFDKTDWAHSALLFFNGSIFEKWGHCILCSGSIFHSQPKIQPALLPPGERC